MNIGILGIGQAGGNIANVAERIGKQYFTTMAINTSIEDLSTLSHVKKKFKIKGTKGGSGKNRSVGIKVVGEYHQEIIEHIQSNFAKCDFLYVVFSAGGGTGSGVSPILIDILSDISDIPIGAIVVLPDINESIITQINASQCFSEIANIDNLKSVFVIDNHKTRIMTKSNNRKKIYDYANKVIINDLISLVDYSGKRSKLGNFDKADLYQLLNSPGYITISKVNLNRLNTDITDESLASAIVNSWDTTIYPEISFDGVLRAGIIYDINENLLQYINNKLIFKDIGNPIELFEGIYTFNNGNIISVLAGLSYPFSRLSVIDSIIEDNKNIIKKEFDKQNKKYKSKLNWFIKLKKKEQKSKKKKSSKVTQKIKKYNS